MKTLITCLITLTLAAFMLLALPIAGEETVYENTLRLHVLAASDSTEDQTAKLLVRDAVLDGYGKDFLALESKAAAQAYLDTHLSEIESTVKATLLENGLSYSVNVTLAREYFDTRAYGEITLPAGEYTALKITLDEGEGQNFWCMLYPALCVAPALGEQTTAKDAYSDAAYTLVTSGYAVRFRALELLSSWFG